MPARKRSTTRRKARTVHHRANPVRRTRKATTHRSSGRRSTAMTHSRRKNPLFAHKRRTVRRHRNPVSGAIGEAIPLVGASFVITFVAPIAQRLVGGFLPLGQFTQPLVVAGTGYGLGWAAGKLGFAKYRKPLEVMGLTLGITALVAPYLRGLLAPSAPAPQQQAGLNGRYNRRNGMGAIMTVPTVPPALMGRAPVAAGNGMGSIATYQTPGRFR